MPADSVKQEPEAPHNLKDCKEGAENGKKTADNLPNTSQSQCNLFWDLRRKVADIVTEFEYTTREAQQLSQKRVTSPPLETIRLTDEEHRLLQSNHQKRLQEIVQKHCTTVIKNLTVYKWAFPFNQPVDVNVYKDYKSFVRKPMDLGTIKQKMNSYRSPHQFEDDVRLVFSNARSYNPEGTDVRRMADAVEEKFSEKWTRNILPKLNEEQRICMEEERTLRQSKASLLVMKTEGDIDYICGQLLERLEKLLEQIHFTQCLAAGICGYVSPEERVRLGWEMTTLAPEHFQRAANLVLTRHPGLMAVMKDNTIQLDLEKMDALTLRQLQDFVNECRKSRHKAGLSGGDSLDGRGRACKRRKTSASTTGSNTPDALHASRSSVQWPHIPYGIGLKPYKPESEPVTPQVPAPPPPRQLVPRTHNDAGKIVHPGQSTFARTATAPAAIPRVNLRPSKGPSILTQVALPTDSRVLPHRAPVGSTPAIRPLMADRGLTRTQSSTPIPTSVPWTAPGFGTATAIPKIIPHVPESTGFVGIGASQCAQTIPLRDIVDKRTSLTTSPFSAPLLRPPVTVSNVPYSNISPASSLPTSFLTTGILPFSQQIPSVISQAGVQGPVGMPGISSPFVIPLVSAGIPGNGPSGSMGAGNAVHPTPTAPVIVHQNQQAEDRKPIAGTDVSMPKSSG